MKLFTSFCNLPSLDSNGNDFSIKSGIPPVVFIGEVLFNIIISDIDKQVTSEFPQLQYIRLFYEILIQIDSNMIIKQIKRLNEIINDCINSYFSHSVVKCIRGGDPIPLKRWLYPSYWRKRASTYYIWRRRREQKKRKELTDDGAMPIPPTSFSFFQDRSNRTSGHWGKEWFGSKQLLSFSLRPSFDFLYHIPTSSGYETTKSGSNTNTPRNITSIYLSFFQKRPKRNRALERT